MSVRAFLPLFLSCGLNAEEVASDLNNFWFSFRSLQIGSDSAQDDVTYKVDRTQIGPTIGWALTF